MRRHRIVTVIALLSLGGPFAAPVSSKITGSELRIVDASDVTKTTPVVNEGGRLQLKVVDGSGNAVAVQSWSTDNRSVGKVNRKRGLLKGKAFGFATITAHTEQGDVSGFIVVARVRTQTGAMTQGDTKTDTGGNVYLSSPTRHVLYKASGLSAEVFAGHTDQSGYQDGTGDGIRFNGPAGIGVDNRAEGGLYIADTMNNCIRKVDFRERSSLAAGVPGFAGTMHGDENPIEDAVFNNPRGVASVGSNLYVTDTNNSCIWYVDVQRQVVGLVAGEPGEPGNANGQGRAARFDRPSGITINTRGNLLAVADTGNNVVRLIAIAPRQGGGVIGNVTTLGLSSSSRNADILAKLDSDRGSDQITFDAPISVSFDGVDNVYVIDNLTASVVTRPSAASGRPVERVDLAQVGTLGDPASVTVRRTQAFVLNEAPASEQDALSVVEVGAPTITSVSVEEVGLAGGEEVIVNGTNFAPESLLTFGDAEVTQYDVLSAGRIRFVTPPVLAPGVRTLTIATRGGAAQRGVVVRAKRLEELTAGEITTVAGGVPDIGDGGLSQFAGLGSPYGVALDAAGNLFIADTENHRVRRVDVASGRITTVAGTGVRGFDGDDKQATAARLHAPQGVAVDAGGNLYVADTANSRIRRVDGGTGQISTVAGTGESGYDGDDKLATAAQLHAPGAIAFDSVGNLFIADSSNERVRRVDVGTGRITTVAGTGVTGYDGDNKPANAAQLNSPTGIALDAAGNLYVADAFNSRVRRVDGGTRLITTVAGTDLRGYDGDGRPATAAQLNFPLGVAVDAAGNLFIADTDNHRIRKVDVATGRIDTVAGTGDAGYDGDDKPATVAQLYFPSAVVVSAAGDLLVADTTNGRMRRVETGTGRISTIVGVAGAGTEGDGGPATAGQLGSPSGVATDTSGNLFIVDTGKGRVRRVSASTGLISTVAGTGVFGYDGDDKPATEARLASPSGIAVDAAGNIFIADSGNNRIRRVDAGTGRITTVAGTGVGGYDGDGSLAIDAQLNAPAGVAVDDSGNLFIADTDNCRIRRVDVATRRIATVAGTGVQGYNGDGGQAVDAALSFPLGVAVDGSGDLLIADTINNRVRRVDAGTGTITTVAGTGDGGFFGDDGPATDAWLATPSGVAVDGSGDIVIADTYNNRVRRVDAETGRITTVAGSDDSAYDGDDGSATDAHLAFPRGVGIDAAGDVVVADTNNGAVRAVKG